MRRLSLAVVVALGSGLAGASAGCGGDDPAIVDARTDAVGDGSEAPDARNDAGQLDASDGDAQTDAAAGDGSVIDAPAIDASVIDAPAIDASVIDAPAVDASVIDARVDAPAVDAPAFDAQIADAPAIDAPAIDAPAIDAPAIDAAPPDAVAIDAAPVPQTFYWADWTAATAGATGTATAGFGPPSGAVTIRYTGAIAFAQTAGGTNFWVPGTPYINAVTANAPPTSDIIALNGSAVVNTLTFDPPVTGLVLGVVSMGAPGTTVRYDFDRPLTLLSVGAGYWGNGTLTVDSGHILVGAEGHGAIQLTGTVAALSWTVIGAENWHGFTIGIPAQ